MARALISRRIVLQVQLMVLLGAPPLARRGDLGDNAPLPPLGVGLFCDVAGDLFLFGIVEVDGGAVLRARIGALAVERRGIVHHVEEFEELAV